MDPELTAPLAEGRTAQVYAWRPGTVLKLYRSWCPDHWVDHEARVARAVSAAGIPTPIPGEVIEVDGRRGLIYERVEGRSMLVEMGAHPWRVFSYARLLAELHEQIHGLVIPGLSSFRQALRQAIERAQSLPAPLRDKTLAALEGLPEGSAVCHGDFHPDNVLMTASGPLVIDWMTASLGDPWADVARTSLIAAVGPLSARGRGAALLRMGSRVFKQLYLARYRTLAQDDAGRLSRWLPVVAAARLNENIQPERDALLRLVEDELEG